MTTTTPPPIPLEPVPVSALTPGVVVPVRADNQFGALRTIATVTPDGTGQDMKIHVTWTDGSPDTTWRVQFRVSVVADSLPGAYWYRRHEELRASLGRLTRQWVTTAGNLRMPNPDGAESACSRDARARQMTLCSAAVQTVINPGRPTPTRVVTTR